MLRRDALRLLGTSLGGVALSACGDGAPTAPARIDAPTLANGFRFFAVKHSDAPLPGGATCRTLLLDAAIDDVGDIVYSAIDQNGARGLYAMTLDYRKPVPAVVSERRIVRVGDALPGGPTVLGITAYDVSPQGALAVVLEVPDPLATSDAPGQTQEIWVDENKGSLRRLVFGGLRTTEGHVLSGNIGDVDIHTGRSLLFVAWYTHDDPHDGQPQPVGAADDDVPREGLFSIVGLDVQTCELELHHEQIASSIGAASIGLIDQHDDGHYVIQAHPSRARDTDEATSGAMRATSAASGAVLFSGRIGQHRARQRTSTQGALNPSLMLSGAGAGGGSFFGPRAGPNAYLAYVLHRSDGHLALYHHDLELVETGDPSPGGSTVGSITPPVFGRHGEIYYTLLTRDGPEFCTANGDEQRLLLSSFDRLANDARKITSLMIGQTTEGVDSSGRLALATVFEDRKAAITVGIPI